MAQFSQNISFRTFNRLCSIHKYIPYIQPSSVYLLNPHHHFSTKQRPRSILSLSNLNRERTGTKRKDDNNESDGDAASYINWKDYDIQLFQYYHDPRASQYRVLLDYFKIEYDVIEITPFNKIEFSVFKIPDNYHHSPLLKMTKRDKLKETINRYKNEAVNFIPNGYKDETLQIANIATFKQRIKEHINEHVGKTQEEKDKMKKDADDLYDFYDSICTEKKK
eukprot:288906_1